MYVLHHISTYHTKTPTKISDLKKIAHTAFNEVKIKMEYGNT